MKVVDVRDFSGADDNTNSKSKKSKRHGLMAWLGEIAFVVVVAIVLSSLLRAFIFQAFAIPSGSMENTLQVNDRVIASKVHDFHRGDVVVFRDSLNWLPPTTTQVSSFRRGLEFIGILPSSSTQHLIKRVIGMPGDRVSCCDAQGRISINGVALDEKEYLYESQGTQVEPSDMKFDVTVPRERIFVLGDHRDASGDSRIHLCDTSKGNFPKGMGAFVPVDDVVGPAKIIVAPRFKRLRIPEAYAQIPPPAEPAQDHPKIILPDGHC